MRLRALAPAKVNLCLFLGPVRPSDGRHELVTVFQSLSLADELVLETLGPGHRDQVHCPEVPGENLATRALDALRGRGWDAPPVRLTIAKRIPIAAGMAGGSADAAAALRLASELAPGRPEEVEAIAAELGADVPAQLAPGVALGTGAGEVVERSSPLAEHAYVVLPSEHALATPAVFAEADRLGLPRPQPELTGLEAQARRAFAPDARPPDALLVNDLAPAAVSLCPPVAEALAAIAAAGADQTLVAGSGPTTLGLFWGPEAAQRAIRAAAQLHRQGHCGALTAAPVGPEAGAPEAF
jgi:4-diphosphocytidyl-2-C-methyl-D-erythritol kinase